MTYVTCRLTAKNRDQLRNPTLSYRVWATFTFFIPSPPYPRASAVVWAQFVHSKFKELFSLKSICLQCFDAVGLAAGRASGL